MATLAPTVTTARVDIRSMGEGDRPRLLAMYGAIAAGEISLGVPPRDAARRELWLESLRRGTNFVAEIEGRLAGHAVLMRSGSGAEMALFVHPDFRRRGIAAALTHAILDAAREQGIRFVWVLISGNNGSARAGLLKAGFRTIWELQGEMQMMYRL